MSHVILVDFEREHEDRLRSDALKYAIELYAQRKKRELDARDAGLRGKILPLRGAKHDGDERR